MAFISTWSDERVATLVQLNSDGLSSSQIAAELGGVTRCAVIGKLQRLGIASAYSPKVEPKTPKEAKPRIIRAKKRTEPVEHRTTFRFERANGNSNALKLIQTIESDIAPLRCVEIEPLNVSLLDLTDDQCRYIAGDDYLYCGHPRYGSSSYCRGHHALCFQPAKPPEPRSRKYFGTDFARGWAA